MNVVEAVGGALDSIGARWAMIGARALGVRGYPRMTLDYDFLTDEALVLQRETWSGLVEKHGAAVEVRKGDLEDPIAGVVRIDFPGGGEADVLLAKWKWEAEVIRRAEPVDLGGYIVPVPPASDLILLKLAAGGPIDLQDVISLLHLDCDRLIREVDDSVASVHPDVTGVWQQIKGSLR
jgi:hypothetical protein